MDSEYMNNKKIMKHCSIIYNIIGYYYIFVYGFTVLGGLILFWLIDGNVLAFFFDAILCKGIILAGGLYSAYKKDNILVLIPTVLIVLDTAFGIAVLNSILLTLTIIASLLNIIANYHYHKLENCEGFPYFSERFDDQDDKYKNKIDVYEENFKRITENSSDKMDEK